MPALYSRTIRGRTKDPDSPMHLGDGVPLIENLRSPHLTQNAILTRQGTRPADRRVRPVYLRMERGCKE